MDNTNNLVYIGKKQEMTDKSDCVKKTLGGYQTNPIMRKNFTISVKPNTHKFSVSDLFE